ncbi:alpha/beta hydrolase [Nocardioides sp. GY 10127]|nr:alpha/beta hydrolase [Nocardioides sp. GY 10127]
MATFVSRLRGADSFEASDEELALGGRYRLREVTTTCPDGHALRLLVAEPASIDWPRPALYYVHTGGMVSGTPKTGLLDVLTMADEVGGVVVSVDYRLAPENPDPTPVEDTYAGLCATFELAAPLGIDPERVVMVGASAGGGLAAGAALLARDRGGPVAAALMLLNPMLDDRSDTFSAEQMVDVDPWDRDANVWAWRALLGDRAAGAEVSEASAPGRATDLAGLPQVLVCVGSVETFRDESVRFAQRIWEAGGAAELRVWPGGFHGYEFVAPHSRLAQETWAARRSWLRRVLAE